VREYREDIVAKGLYLMRDGRVLVDFGTRQVPISFGQYRANGYRPPCDQLPAEAESKARTEFAKADAPKVTREDSQKLARVKA
jgi:hypothetical protein